MREEAEEARRQKVGTLGVDDDERVLEVAAGVVVPTSVLFFFIIRRSTLPLSIGGR